MKMLINAQYQNLEEFIKRLPVGFEQEGKTIYKSRNELKIFEKEGISINVKHYRKPIWLNRVAYTFFRKSKARRAYENALTLLDKGFETPNPVAYLEIHEKGLLKDSFFIALHCPYKRLFREFADNSSIDGREEIVQAFGVTLARLHEANIFHLDLSVGNILFDKLKDGYHFSLVDLNRMKFQKICLNDGCRNFERLRGSDDFFKLLAKTYANERGFDVETCIRLALKAQQKSIQHFHRKRQIKKAIFH